MITGRVVRGAFTRIAALGTGAARSLIRQAPKGIMDSSSIRMGRILGNMRRMPTPRWSGMGMSALRHVQEVGAFGSTPSNGMKYMQGMPFVVFAKTSGMQANHGSSDGIGLALSRARHTNLL